MTAYLILEWREWLERDFARDALLWALLLWTIPLLASYHPHLTSLLLAGLSLFQGWRRGSRYHQDSEQRKRLVLPSSGSAGPASAVAATGLAALVSWTTAASTALPLFCFMAELWSFPPETVLLLFLLGAASALFAFGFSLLLTLGSGAGAEQAGGSLGSLGIFLMAAFCFPGLFWKPLAWMSPFALTISLSSGAPASPWTIPFLVAAGLLLLCLCALILHGRRKAYHGY